MMDIKETWGREYADLTLTCLLCHAIYLPPYPIKHIHAFKVILPLSYSKYAFAILKPKTPHAPKPQHHHPSPHPSSSSVTFGAVSIFFATTGLAFTSVTAAFFVPVPPTLPVVATLAAGAGLPLDAAGFAASPFGKGFPAPGFFCCAASQPAKSGSPSSWNGFAADDVEVLGVDSLGASKKDSSSMSPHASMSSSAALESWK